MGKKPQAVIFVGEALKKLSEETYPHFNTFYLQNPDELPAFLEEKEITLDKTSIFIGLYIKEDMETLIKNLEDKLYGLFIFTPLVACFPDGGIEKIKGIERFDYLVFHPLDLKEVEKIVWFLNLKKGLMIDEKKLLYINQAIVQSLYEKLKQRGGLKEEEGLAYLYYCIDENGIIKNISNGVLNILGFSKEEIIGRHFTDLISKSEYERVKRAFTERRTGERRAKDIVVKLKRKDGGFREFIIEAQGIHVPSLRELKARYPKRVYIGTFGEVKSIEGLMDDYYRVKNPIIIYNLSDNILDINKGFEKFSGYSREEIIEKSPAFFERKDKSYFNQYLNELKSKKHCAYNTFFICKLGEERFCEVTFDLLEIAGKSYIFGIYTDLSSLIKVLDEAETIIHLSWVMGNTSTLEELIEVAGEKGISILNVPLLSIVTVNEKSREINRFYLKSTKGEGWANRGKELFNDLIEQVIQEAIKDNKTIYRDTSEFPENCGFNQYIDDKGEATLIFSPLIVNNRGIGCMIVLHKKSSGLNLKDIRVLELTTNVIAGGIHRLNLETQLKRNLENLERRIKERTKELEDFVYTVSHDLKSPLHVAKGFADVVKTQFAPFVKKDEDLYVLRRIDENISQAINMINDLLTLSRLGTVEPRFERVDVREIIEDYFTQFSALKDEDLLLHREIKGKLPVVYADRGRLIQLFTNIFDNAIKYRKGNSVKIIITSDVTNDRARVSVRDNGIGIDERDLPNVFNVFYRGKSQEKVKHPEGSGVGLTIVKKIIDQLGWNIWFESMPGEGTTVTIEIPLNKNR